MSVVHEVFGSNGSVIQRIVDNGDGTGVRTVYDANGNQIGDAEDVTGLPIPEEPEPTIEDQLAEVQAALNALAGD